MPSISRIARLLGAVILLELSLVLGGSLVGDVASVISVREAQACGVNSHLWITDSAICQLPMTSPLRALYEEQVYVDLSLNLAHRVRSAQVMGAVYQMAQIGACLMRGLMLRS